ncbi:unnamed protein product, partial [Prorocentrum cordatum]
MRPGYLPQILSGPIAAGLLALSTRRQPCPAPLGPPSCPETCAEAPPCVCPGAPACVCPEPAACPLTKLGWEEVLIRYDGGDAYHERVAPWPQTHAIWVILTPEFDMCSEMIDGSESVDGVVRIVGLRSCGRLPRLDKPAYRFKQALDLDTLKGYAREGRPSAARPALQDGAAAGDPPIEVADVVMPNREAAGSDAGAAPALAAVGDDASPAHPQAGPLDMPRGHAWVLMEGGRADNLGDELVLGPGGL